MRKLFVCALILISILAFAEDNDVRKPNPAFSYLSALYISSQDVYVYYPSKKAKIINLQFDQLNKEHKLYCGEDLNASDVLVMEIQIGNKKSKKYHLSVGCGSASSCKEFRIHPKNSSKVLAEFTAREVYIPGNGFIYTTDDMGTTWAFKSKYRFTGTKLIKVKQPFYYIGIETETTKPIKLYQSRKYKKVIATLGSFSKVKVLLGYKEGMLVKTPFGLVGWHKSRSDSYWSENQSFVDVHAKWQP